MKRFLVSLIVLLVATCLFSDGIRTLVSSSQIIQARKGKVVGEVPVPEVTLVVTDSSQVEVSEAGEVSIPLLARTSDYTSFLWVLSGDVYGPVSVKFKFYPMYWEGVDTSTSIISYSVELRHLNSKIGNAPLKVGEKSSVSTFTTNNFTEYYYKYADNVTIPAKATVTTSSNPVEMTVTYNMAINTVVEDTNGSEINYNTYKSTYDNVCDYWVREGQVDIRLTDITSDSKNSSGQLYKEGVYSAKVEVVISAT